MAYKILNKKDLNTQVFLMEIDARVFEGVQRITGETRNFLGDDEVKRPVFGIRDHLVEVLALLGGDARKSLVHVAGNKGPGWIHLDEILVVRNLVVR